MRETPNMFDCVNIQGLFLWLDDEKPAPPGWTWVKTCKELAAHLGEKKVAAISFDYYLNMTDTLHNGEVAVHHVWRNACNWYNDILQCDHMLDYVTYQKKVDAREVNSVGPICLLVHSFSHEGQKVLGEKIKLIQEQWVRGLQYISQLQAGFDKILKEQMSNGPS